MFHIMGHLARNQTRHYVSTSSPGVAIYDCRLVVVVVVVTGYERRTSHSERGRRGHVLDVVRVLPGVGDRQLGKLDDLVMSVDREPDSVGRGQRLTVVHPLTVRAISLGQVARQRRRLRLEAFNVLQLQRDLHRLVCQRRQSSISKSMQQVTKCSWRRQTSPPVPPPNELNQTTSSYVRPLPLHGELDKTYRIYVSSLILAYSLHYMKHDVIH